MKAQQLFWRFSSVAKLTTVKISVTACKKLGSVSAA
jgi:hypothetical protein